AEIKSRPAALKGEIQGLEETLKELESELDVILLQIPQPPDGDVPVGASAEDNVEIRRWAPAGWDWSKSFEANRGFRPKTHLELCEDLGLVDFPRGVKLSGSRSYVLTGDGMRLHQAVLRYAMDFMAERHGFAPMSVPVIVREEAMTGTGFFPSGREQAYHIEERARGAGHDLYLTGTGEVGLMGLHQSEILDEEALPLRYVTVSTCFRREAESRAWHERMLGYVTELLESLELPHRLLQCCTGDLGPKNADMIDVECWMPGRGEAADPEDPGAGFVGDFGETHSASRLYDFQCRRLNLRCRPGGEGGKGATAFCHSLNNTVAASPRILIPILEMHQRADGSVRVPDALRSYFPRDAISGK
ncbi:MAG: aminoacyl--tRNA ligase-related protein, partial [Planctomycetota bacterium]